MQTFISLSDANMSSAEEMAEDMSDGKATSDSEEEDAPRRNLIWILSA